LDVRTVQVTLNHPTSYFLSLLLYDSWQPVHLKTVEKFGGLDRKGTRWTRPENYVGHGPFVLSEWSPNQYIAVKRGPTYWGCEQVKLNEVRFSATENTDTEGRMFRTGQLHLTRGLPTSKTETYRNGNSDFPHIDKYLATAYYRVNTERPHLSDPRVRRALSLAVDRIALAEQVLKVTKVPAYNLTPPGTLGLEAGPQFPTDFEGARALRVEAGFSGGQRFAAGRDPLPVVGQWPDRLRGAAGDAAHDSRDRGAALQPRVEGLSGYDEHV
jgi:oligopeptide transport system substrate-binding protein